MEQLVVRLGSQVDDAVFWIVWSKQENEIIASGQLDSAAQLNTLVERAGQRSVTALVPTSDVLLKWLELPAKAGRKALAAIPYMLEDELTVNVDEQFFAIGPRQGNRQAVAVVDRQKMHQWTGLMAEAGLHCDKLLPDILALPVNEQGWTLLAVEHAVLLRQDQWSGIQGEPEWLFAAINHYAKQQPEPLKLANYSDIELPHLANVEVQEQQLDMPMQVLVAGALSSKFNLLQAEFTPRKRQSGRWQQWRLAAILAGVALLTSLLDKGIELYQLKQQKAALTAQIEAEYKRAFPNARRIVNVRSQMRQQLNSLETGGSGVSMLVMMSQLSDAFASSQVRPQSLRFDRDRAEIRMQAAADNFESLEQFKRQAEATGFTVEQGAINNKDNQVIGSLSVRS